MDIQSEIIQDLARFQDRPYNFVLWAFPWGEPGTELEDISGPDTWQKQVLLDLQSGRISFSEACFIAVRSGHGVGKSAFLSWIILWAISTMEDTRGRVTANTKEQLMRVLWGELAKWHRLFLARDLFKLTATAIYSADPIREKTWRIDAIPWSEENPEAFAGLHNFGKRLVIICDEASAIANVIWEVLDGATTDQNTQILWIVTGNPTRNSGRYRDCFERFSQANGGQWWTYRVDSRESAFSNKSLIQRWLATHGEDSDFFRVRVRGEFPNAATTQLIPIELIRAAQIRPAQSTAFDPLILGVDIARFGNNASVAQFRRGKDARTVPSHTWRNASVVETANRVAGLIVEFKPDAVFIDEGGVGGGVVDVVRYLGHSVVAVNFGSSPGTRPGGILVANKRAEMYVLLRDWLSESGVLPPDEDLLDELVSIEYHFDRKQQIQLVSKEDMRSIGKDSPDWADALALTFAFPVAPAWSHRRGRVDAEYDPYSIQALREPIGVYH